MIDIFIPSYHRPTNVKTAKYFVRLGYDPKNIHVFVDDETDDISEYEDNMSKLGVQLHVFDMEEARLRYDYVHRASASRRSAGQARNMMFDFARINDIDFYVVIDDDTQNYQIRNFGVYSRCAALDDVVLTFEGVREMMQRKRIGLFGISQTGDMFERYTEKVLRKKVMNTTFYDTRFIYRGERGVQDDDTSLFAGVMNEGLFTGSLASGLVLLQTSSAKAKGGLTDLYNECKLLNKAMVCPIQFPSAVICEKQKRNGGRLHHRISYRNLYPMVIRGERNNLAWDTYPEDTPFTNEPHRSKKQ